MAKGYWILHVTVTDPGRYPDYVALDTPIVTAHGGRFLVRGGQYEAPETPQRDRHVIVEFPSYQAAVDCYRRAGYQEAATIRRAASDCDIVIVEGTAP